MMGLKTFINFVQFKNKQPGSRELFSNFHWFFGLKHSSTALVRLFSRLQKFHPQDRFLHRLSSQSKLSKTVGILRNGALYYLVWNSRHFVAKAESIVAVHIRNKVMLIVKSSIFLNSSLELQIPSIFPTV